MAKEQYTKTIYIYDGKEFDGEGLEIEDVKTLLSATFPEIANSTTKVEIKDGVRRITFTKVAGTKGITSVEISKKLSTLKPCEFLGANIILSFLKKEKFDLEKQISELEILKNKADNKAEDSSSILERFKFLRPKTNFTEGI